MKGQDAPVRTKRAYDPPDRSDGAPGLVDRLGPRGLCKENSALTCWLKESHRRTEPKTAPTVRPRSQALSRVSAPSSVPNPTQSAWLGL
jgi:hypothetical protein